MVFYKTKCVPPTFQTLGHYENCKGASKVQDKKKSRKSILTRLVTTKELNLYRFKPIDLERNIFKMFMKTVNRV